MFTVDANRCPSCIDRETCEDRKLVIPALSSLAHTLNTDPKHVDGPGEGLIIFNCRQHV